MLRRFHLQYYFLPFYAQFSTKRKPESIEIKLQIKFMPLPFEFSNSFTGFGFHLSLPVVKIFNFYTNISIS